MKKFEKWLKKLIKQFLGFFHLLSKKSVTPSFDISFSGIFTKSPGTRVKKNAPSIEFASFIFFKNQNLRKIKEKKF